MFGADDGAVQVAAHGRTGPFHQARLLDVEGRAVGAKARAEARRHTGRQVAAIDGCAEHDRARMIFPNQFTQGIRIDFRIVFRQFRSQDRVDRIGAAGDALGGEAIVGRGEKDDIRCRASLGRQFLRFSQQLQGDIQELAVFQLGYDPDCFIICHFPYPPSEV